MTRSTPTGDTFPILPLRDIVVFPHMIVPLFVGREKSIKALEEVMGQDKQILLATQKNAADDDPGNDGIYDIGTLANVLQLLKLPDGTVKVLVEGVSRARIASYSERAEFHEGVAELLVEPEEDEVEIEALARSVVSDFENYVKLNKKISPEVVGAASQIDDYSKLADTVASHLAIKITEKQEMLATLSVKERLEKAMGFMEAEISVLQVEKRIRSRVKRQMEKTQREYYLNEQMKAIQKELGEGEDGRDETAELEERIKKTKLSKEAREKANAELKKLRTMSPMSAEATVVRNYLDWLLSIPWGRKSKVKYDLDLAQEVLDADHFGLDKVKDRIVEYLAVQSRQSKLKGPILCLVGPPGVGKTSLGKSIARATGREFVRMALGGVRDEAEIRGHRRTYVGSLPGRIIQGMKRAGTNNPVFVLDEIDKLGHDFRGDPSSALLEVLDPEQNNTFSDHYLEVPFDLSKVMFIATANILDPIPAALRDRLEILEIPGYTRNEKIMIAKNFLIPKQIEEHGMTKEQLTFDDTAVAEIIDSYTREAGVRNLEREVGSVCRGVAVKVAEGEVKDKVDITSGNVPDFLGPQKFMSEVAERTSTPGVATGLAWTAVGGDILFVEATRMPGKSALMLTGQLGDVMKESAHTATSFVRSHAKQLGIDENFLERADIHVHVPAGAIPKDGPSAGVTMYTALTSMLTGIPVRADVAMTGEITLRGNVLPVGGIKEKLLAAHRAGIKRVVLPERNKKDIVDVPDEVKKDMEILYVSRMEELLPLVLTDPLPSAQAAAPPAPAAPEGTPPAPVPSN